MPPISNPLEKNFRPGSSTACVTGLVSAGVAHGKAAGNFSHIIVARRKIMTSLMTGAVRDILQSTSDDVISVQMVTTWHWNIARGKQIRCSNSNSNTILRVVCFQVNLNFTPMCSKKISLNLMSSPIPIPFTNTFLCWMELAVHNYNRYPISA